LDSNPQPSLSAALDALWSRFLPEMENRVAILIAAAGAAQSGRLTDVQRENACAAAHKLAGTLGTFGLDRGTTLARNLENAYAEPSGHSTIPAADLIAITAELRDLIKNRK
jgi:HPt (histidine-containing phosphotransfer) domain-containing protein